MGGEPRVRAVRLVNCLNARRRLVCTCLLPSRKEVRASEASTTKTGEIFPKLQALHQSGALTDSEFGAAKAKLLRSSGGSTSAAPIVQGSAVPVVQAEQVVVNVASGSATVGGPRPAELDDLFGPTSQDDELEQQKVQKRFLELQRRSKDQDTTATTRNSFRHRYLMRTKTPPPRSDELRHEQELRAHFLKSSKERHKLFYS